MYKVNVYFFTKEKKKKKVGEIFPRLFEKRLAIHNVGMSEAFFEIP